jgi:hypothetical protein
MESSTYLMSRMFIVEPAANEIQRIPGGLAPEVETLKACERLPQKVSIKDLATNKFPKKLRVDKLNIEKSLDYYISKLPPYLGKEIFKFIIEDSLSITFQNYYIYSANRAYSPKYLAAYSNKKFIQNNNGLYLSRITKKNGKHRYYITEEFTDIECDGCGRKKCCSLYCRGKNQYDYYIISKYVGKDIDKALLEFYLI